ncbi:MAG: BadF/BadG/BcrA/BcrD ATPase family protein [Candidatus Bathyarchaeia archaeon]
MLVLGVDGGATKTVCAISDENFQVLGVGISGPCNYNVVGIEKARKNVRSAVKHAFSDLDLKDRIAEIGCFGIGGLTTERDYEVISNQIVPSDASKRRIIVNDVVIAFYAVTCGSPGIVVVAGTGSIAYGLNSRGESAFSSGWGWLMGDEGSAFDIARQALIAAAKAYDGRGERTVLVEMFKETFKVEDFKDVVPKIYHEVTSTGIASLSKVVFSAAEEGDKVAIKILKNAGRELGRSVISIARKLFMESEPIIVGASGGVFIASDIVWFSLKKYVRSYLPNALFTSPVKHPVMGALIMGYKNLGVNVDDKAKATLLQNLERKIARL